MISLIICTYNRDKYIYSTLEHIAACEFPPDRYEVLVINNNSTDKTASECDRFVRNHPEIDIRIIMEHHQGLSFARNRGIKESRGDVLVFLDDDALVQNDYMKRLEQYLLEYPSMMAFGGKIDPLFESGEVPSWLCRWNSSWLSALNLGTEVKCFKKGHYPIGANMGFRKVCFNEIGLFNTALGRSKKNLIGGEEKDIFGRITANGHILYYLPELYVHHVIPPGRTNTEYIRKLGLGVGSSERIRTEGNRLQYLKRICAEVVKWAASLTLWLYYALMFSPKKGNSLILFRWNVTKGLIS